MLRPTWSALQITLCDLLSSIDNLFAAWVKKDSDKQKEQWNLIKSTTEKLMAIGNVFGNNLEEFSGEERIGVEGLLSFMAKGSRIFEIIFRLPHITDKESAELNKWHEELENGIHYFLMLAKKEIEAN